MTWRDALRSVRMLVDAFTFANKDGAYDVKIAGSDPKDLRLISFESPEQVDGDTWVRVAVVDSEGTSDEEFENRVSHVVWFFRQSGDLERMHKALGKALEKVKEDVEQRDGDEECDNWRNP